jgi:hypothetical protein
MGFKTQNEPEYTSRVFYMTDNYDTYLIVVKEFFKFLIPPMASTK